MSFISNLRRCFLALVSILVGYFLFNIFSPYDFSSIFTIDGPRLKTHRYGVNLPPLVGYDIPSSSGEDLIYILAWTRRFHTVWPQEEIRNCARIPAARCLLTSSREFLNRSAALIFHARDLHLFSDIPSIKYRYQKYIFYNHESPLLTRVPLQGAVQKYFFDWTMTYRRDSSVYCPYAYFELLNHTSSYQRWGFPENYDIKFENLAKRTKTVAWFVSNCETDSKRERYIYELQKHINVDIFGDCGTMTCSKKERWKCMQILAETYKFYIGFENSVCVDYVSEKYTNRLELNLVVIVLRRSDYENLTPSFPGDDNETENSSIPHRWARLRQRYRRSWYFFIAADDFENPKDLADYLNFLNENPTEYLKYFEWKKYWRVVVTGDRHCNCELCALLYEERQKLRDAAKNGRSDTGSGSTDLDIHEWWNKGTCRSNYGTKLAKRRFRDDSSGGVRGKTRV